jgi:ABC-2 type transport system ATP-binding protein
VTDAGIEIVRSDIVRKFFRPWPYRTMCGHGGRAQAEAVMSEVVVSVRGLRKVYGEMVALRDVSFEVGRGEVFALLGPNGSGKTTTLETLEGLRRPDGGSLSIDGIDPLRDAAKLRNRIGVQLQASALPPAMTVEESMRFFCTYHGVPPRSDLIARLGLSEKRRTPYGQLSAGQQRRLALAVAVAHEPAVVFLDEPTAGLDVQSRVALHALVGELKARGATVVLATHDMAEAEKLADRAAILLHGRIAAVGTPLQLTAASSRETRISVATETGRLVERLPRFPGATCEGERDGYARYLSSSVAATVSAVVAWLEQEGDPLVDLRVERPSLEERFLEITKNPGAKGGAA